VPISWTVLKSKFKNCSCVYHCAQLLYTTQVRTVLIIFPLSLRTIVTAWMMSTGGEEEPIQINIMKTITETLKSTK